MRRALALMALSLFLSLVATAVMTLIARPDVRDALREIATRWPITNERRSE